MALEWFEVHSESEGVRWVCSVNAATKGPQGEPIERTYAGVVWANPVGAGWRARIEQGEFTEHAMQGGRGRQQPRVFKEFANAKAWVARRLRPHLEDFQEAFRQAVEELHAAPFATEREKKKPYVISKDGRYFRLDGINYQRKDVRRILNILRERACNPSIEEATRAELSNHEIRQLLTKLEEMYRSGIIVPRDHKLVV
jgi:hypothetical protein